MIFHRSLALAALAGVLLSAAAIGAPGRHARTARRKALPAAKAQQVAKPPISRLGPLTPEEARQTVALLDDAYQTWLEEAHEQYHPRPGKPVAAKVVRELQEKMGSLGWPQSHFLAVNALVMRPEHQPQDAFERDAVRRLSGGAPRVETISGNTMRVATGLSLGGGCGTCHWAEQGVVRRAAITWAMPLKAGSLLAKPEASK